MNQSAEFQQRNFRTHMAGFFRATLAALAVVATWGAPTLASAQVSAPTGATLPRGGLPVLVQWTPSYYTVHGSAPTVDILFYQMSPGSMQSLGPLATSVNMELPL